MPMENQLHGLAEAGLKELLAYRTKLHAMGYTPPFRFQYTSSPVALHMFIRDKKNRILWGQSVTRWTPDEDGKAVESDKWAMRDDERARLEVYTAALNAAGEVADLIGEQEARDKAKDLRIKQLEERYENRTTDYRDAREAIKALQLIVNQGERQGIRWIKSQGVFEVRAKLGNGVVIEFMTKPTQSIEVQPAATA